MCLDFGHTGTQTVAKGGVLSDSAVRAGAKHNGSSLARSAPVTTAWINRLSRRFFNEILKLSTTKKDKWIIVSTLVRL